MVVLRLMTLGGACSIQAELASGALPDGPLVDLGSDRDVARRDPQVENQNSLLVTGPAACFSDKNLPDLRIRTRHPGRKAAANLFVTESAPVVDNNAVHH